MQKYPEVEGRRENFPTLMPRFQQLMALAFVAIIFITTQASAANIQDPQIQELTATIQQMSKRIETLEIGENKINSTVEHSQRNIDAFKEKVRLLQSFHSSPNATQVYLGCSGIINAQLDVPLVTKYKFSNTYANNESCLWNLNNTRPVAKRSKLRVLVKLLSHGFPDVNDQVRIYKWNRDTGLSSEKLILGVEREFFEEMLYLSFTSSGSGTGTGFAVSFRVTESNSDANYNGENQFSSLSASSWVLSGRYVEHDTRSMMIHAKEKISFTIDYLNANSYNNCSLVRIDVYEIQQTGSFNLQKTLCGQHSTPTTLPSTSWPILAIFSSDGVTTGSGWKVSWKPPAAVSSG